MSATNIFKPILFNTEMVQAILAGRKTQTRRVLKLKTPVDIKGVEVDCYLRLDLIPTNMQVFYANKKDKQINLYSDNEYAKYKPGDILWVRETFTECKTPNIPHDRGWKFCYKADGGFGVGINWKPSLFMPKEAARIFLKVTNVRCERLNDISEEDAIAEGIIKCFVGNPTDFENSKMRVYRSSKLEEGNVFAIDAFKELWQSINAKKHPWESNPWVWVYDFERIEKPENF